LFKEEIVLAKIKMLTAFYLLAHKRRQEWANWKWRIFATLVVLAVLFYVNDYLAAKYYATVSFTRPDGEAVAFLLSDKLFYWFATGVLIGMVCLALIYEGEFVLGLLKIGRGIENEFEKDTRTVGKSFADAERLIEKEVERGTREGIELVTPSWARKARKLVAAKKAKRKR
jgi:hypothetical protein